MRRKISAILICFLITVSASSQNSKFNQLKNRIKADLLLLQTKTLTGPDNRDYDFYDNLDAYCNRTARKISKLLLFDEARTPLDLSDFKYNEHIAMFELSAKTDDKHNIRIYNFGYDCGGSRGWITYPIIQWTNDAGKLFTYNLSQKINSEFTGIYALPDDYYLLLGDEKGSGACRVRTAYVIRFKRDYLLLDSPAFVNHPGLSFCNVEFTFNEETKELTCQAQEMQTTDGEVFYDISAFNLQYNYPDKTERNKMYSLLSIDYNTGEFKVKFSNGKFHKTRKSNSEPFFRVYEE